MSGSFQKLTYKMDEEEAESKAKGRKNQNRKFTCKAQFEMNEINVVLTTAGEGVKFPWSTLDVLRRRSREGNGKKLH